MTTDRPTRMPTIWGVDHAKGAIVVVRPDLWVGMSAFPSETVNTGPIFWQLSGASK